VAGWNRHSPRPRGDREPLRSAIAAVTHGGRRRLRHLDTRRHPISRAGPRPLGRTSRCSDVGRRHPPPILGGSAQPRDLQDLVAVCGERDEELRNWSRGADGGRTVSTSTRRLPILPPDAIRTLPSGTGVLLARTAPPILLKMTPWTDRLDADQIRHSIFESS
jgi:hypothetical protein